MTAKITALRVPQPESFTFLPESIQQAQAIIARYPQGMQQSALMPLLSLAQAQCGNWLPKAAMDYVAAMLNMPPVRVYEVASFYTMYNLEPVGKHVIEVCTTTPCWLSGSEAIVQACEKRLGITLGETTADGEFTLREVECLGACVNAPMAQVISSPRGTQYFYEDLTPERITGVIDAFTEGRQPKPGPQSGRKSSEPAT
ncbi:MAG: NADH-quinone oxidoreductase subunit NuoE [Alphaproteobacteria bacterium]|nr:NADH-quinone oxidoreductase subunit NuoE [Alphaproteobacteria bacterium]